MTFSLDKALDWSISKSAACLCLYMDFTDQAESVQCENDWMTLYTYFTFVSIAIFLPIATDKKLASVCNTFQANKIN